VVQILGQIIEILKMATTQVETKLYAMVSCLADNYGFDADEAFEYVRWETDVDHVGELFAMVEKPAKSTKTTKAPKEVSNEVPNENSVKDDASTSSNISDKIDVCKKNIELWQKKLNDGKTKDSDKQREKIEKEQKKLEKLLEKEPRAVIVTKKEEPKKVESVNVNEKKEKRIKRFSPVMAGQLKTALDNVKVEMNDKLKKEFQQYIEDLTDDDYTKNGLADHMRAFANLQAPPTETEPEAKEEEESVTMKNVDDKVVVDVTLKELQTISMTASIEPTGTFWDADNGRFIKGPESDDDEDFEEKTFEGTKYVVGEKTGRVYEARDTGDVFVGFIGVGKFKKLTK
jgi:hypothetical protein